MKKYVAKLVTFGRGGDTVEFGKGCRCEGYGNPERPHAAEPSADKVFPDGTPVIDKCAAVETEAGCKLAIHGPMVNVDLEAGQMDRCPSMEDSIVGQAMLKSGNAYGTLTALQICARHKKKEYGPLDCVDTATYVQLWREVGARIGQYLNGQIVWEK